MPHLQNGSFEDQVYPIRNTVTKHNSTVPRTNAISDDSILLDAHKVSPQEISAKSIVQELRNSLRLNFGDYGAARANSLLQIKYFSNSTSTGIIRCLREDVDLVLLALFFINSVNGSNLIVNPVKVSGTIKQRVVYNSKECKLSLAVRRRGESTR